MANYEANGLTRLIENKLIVDEADRMGMEINKDVVNERLEEMKGTYDSEQDFLESLVSEGLTVTDLKKRIIEQMKSQFIIEREVKSKIFVTPKEITEHYQSHIDEFQKPERANLDSIFIPQPS